MRIIEYFQGDPGISEVALMTEKRVLLRVIPAKVGRLSYASPPQFQERSLARAGMEASMSYLVKVGFDPIERRYFALFSDIPGLNIEADTFEAFVEATQDAAPDLIGERPQGTKIRFEREVVLAN